MKSKTIAYLLWLFLGWLGIHRLYTGNYVTGLIWMFTGGLFLVGWAIDLFLTGGLVDTANMKFRMMFTNQGININVVNGNNNGQG